MFLATASSIVGEQHTSFQLQIWTGEEWAQWSIFGAGGWVLHPGGTAPDHGLAGWVLAQRLLPALQVEAELYHQNAEFEHQYSWYAAVRFTF